MFTVALDDGTGYMPVSLSVIVSLAQGDPARTGSSFSGEPRAGTGGAVSPWEVL